MKTKIAVFAAIIAVSCSGNNDITLVHVQGPAREQTVSHVTSFEIPSEIVSSLEVLDSLLLIRGQNQLIVYNRNRDEYKKAYREGRGPGEMTGFYDFTYNDRNRELYLLDITSQSILMCSVDSLLAGNNPVRNTKRVFLYNVPLLFSLCYGGGELYAMGTFNDCRIATLNGADTLLYKPARMYSPQLEGKEKASFGIINQAYHGTMSFENSKKTLVVADRYSDQLELITKDEVKVIKGHKGIDPMYDVVKMGDFDVLSHKREERKGFIDVATTDSRIYALFSGRTVRDENGSYGNEIWAFSWDGKLDCIYHLDQDIISFDVDASSHLFGIADDTHIYEYILD